MRQREATPFGDLLRQHRIAKGLTQEALAERAGLGERTIKGIEEGARHLPRADTIFRLIVALELSSDQEAILRRALRCSEPDNTDNADISDKASSPLTLTATATTLGGPLPTTHLMSYLTPLIGRDEFIHDALAKLSKRTTRLMTLVGPPGVGKTRIGLEIAKRASEAPEQFSESIERVESIALASLRQPSLILPAIVHAVGMKEVYGSTLLDALVSALRGTRTLLFLDNFEHLLDATSDIVALLARCPDLKIIITSRVALRVRGEHELPVPPLAVPALVSPFGPDSARTNLNVTRMVAREQSSVFMPDTTAIPVIVGGAIRRASSSTGLVADLGSVPSVALFVQRAQDTAPDFALNEQNAPIIAEICRQLDGLPLALELAASRLRLFTPSELLGRLTSRLSILAEHAPDLPSRHQTMRDTIAWSYVLLTSREQWTFRQLGVCANGCSLHAAEAICGREGNAPHVLDDLTTLVAHSLIHRGERAHGNSYITMLEAIHEYALEQLDSHGERDAAAQAHSAYFCSFLESIVAGTESGGHGAFDLKVLDDDYANLQAALGWAIDRHDVAMGERLVAGMWRYWYMRGFLTEGRRWAESLLEMVGDTDQRWMNERFPLAASQGTSGTEEGSSIERHQHGETLTRSANLAAALNGAGMLAFRQGDHVTATTWLRRSLALYRWRGDKRGIAAVLNNLGIVVTDQGLYAEARTFHEESLAMKRELSNAHDIAISLNNLGCVARAQGQFAQATAFFEENLSIQRALGDTYRIAHALGNLGTQAYVQSEYDQAYEHYLECLALQKRLGDSQGIALTTLNLGEVAKARGALSEALTKARDSVAMFRALGEPMRVVSALSLLASTSYAQGDSRSAWVYLQEILDLSRKLVSHRAVHQWAILLARLAYDEGLHIIATQFLVVAESQRTANGATWTPTEQQDYDLCLTQLRRHVKASDFQEAQDAASAWSWEELLMNARECLVRRDRLP